MSNENEPRAGSTHMVTNEAEKSTYVVTDPRYKMLAPQVLRNLPSAESLCDGYVPNETITTSNFSAENSCEDSKMEGNRARKGTNESHSGEIAGASVRIEVQGVGFFDEQYGSEEGNT